MKYMSVTDFTCTLILFLLFNCFWLSVMFVWADWFSLCLQARWGRVNLELLMLGYPILNGHVVCYVEDSAFNTRWLCTLDVGSFE